MDVEQAVATVRPICDDVRERGLAAVREATERFDGVRPDRLRVPAADLQRALAELDPAVRAALAESIRRARLVHRDQRRTDRTTDVVPGGSVSERWLPVGRVGLYVPGNIRYFHMVLSSLQLERHPVPDHRELLVVDRQCRRHRRVTLGRLFGLRCHVSAHHHLQRKQTHRCHETP